MFKIGDKVIRVYGNSGNMNEGDVGTVKKIINNEWMELEEYTERHLIKRFELVESKNMTKEEKIEFLNREMIDISENNPDRRIKELERNINVIKEDIRRYREYMNESYSSYKNFMKEIEGLKNKGEITYKNDFEALISHKYVEDVKINKHKKEIKVLTDYIDIYDEEDYRFKGNKYELTFDFNKMTCYIVGLDNEYNRKSYWTTTDPHPHVNGDTGEACWGSAGSMLTDNMNNYEVYASFIVVLNFLQQVNTGDAAGAYIRNWDCIDENGRVIENPHEGDYATCCICEYETDREEMYYCEDCQEYMCDDHSYYIEYGCKNVCESCFDDNYTTCEHCSDRMHLDSEDRRVVDGDTFCSSCFEHLFKVCEGCNEAIDKDEISVINDKNYCDECYDEKFIVCDECGRTTPKEDTFYCDHCSSTLCTDCFDEPIPGMCQDCFDKEEEEVEEAESI